MPSVDTYKIEDNDLVNKYLNMNPEDIITTKYSSINNIVPSAISIGATDNYGSSYESSNSHFTSSLTHYQSPAIEYNYTKDYYPSSNAGSSLTIDNSLTSKYD
jgi:hypothetical protein